MTTRVAVVGLFIALALPACGQSGEIDLIGPLTPRAGTIVAEACILDDTQLAALDSPAAKRVVGSVVLLCLAGGATGAVMPLDGSTWSTVQAGIDRVRAGGYKVLLGFTMGDSGMRYDAATAGPVLADDGWRAAVARNLDSLPLSYDGLEIALPRLDASAADGVRALVALVGTVVRATHPLGLFVPPSVTYPSDVVGADAYDLFALAPSVDRFRIMTLDFSCCGAGAGPTIDSGWAVDAERFAAKSVADSALDVAVPLYGTDFGAGDSHALSYDEAEALATAHRAEITALPTGARHFDYLAGTGTHIVWFDDARSTLRTLSAWSPAVMPSRVGVVYYGLGDEDPQLWKTLAGELP